MAPGFKGSVMNPAEGRNPCRFGEIPGFPVGSRFKGRRELCDAGVHALLTNGIHGRGKEGAFSIVLSGGYEDDVDEGYQFTYTGQGGQARREIGVKWSNKQIRDQEWNTGNLALKVSCELGRPVRVIRGSSLNSSYAPAEGYRYDGLYTVEEAEMKKGKSNLEVCIFRLVRCGNQLPLPNSSVEQLPMWEPPKTPKTTQDVHTPRSSDSAPVASSSRVQLTSGDRSNSEPGIVALSTDMQRNAVPPSPSKSSTLPTTSSVRRNTKEKDRPHPYKRASRPLSMHPVVVFKGEARAESGSVEPNWLDGEMMKTEPEEEEVQAEMIIQDPGPSPSKSPELEEEEIDEIDEIDEEDEHQAGSKPVLPADTNDDDIYD